MLNVLICLAGVAAVLVASEMLYSRRLLRGERERKFIHIIVGCYVAAWPWLISWHWIQVIGLGMLAIVLANHRRQKLHISGGVHRRSWGEIFFALAIVLCASLTNVKVFFAIAILHLALADGLAALFGKKYGSNWKYHFWGANKTLVGSATFWLCSLTILGFGLLAATSQVGYSHYVLLCLALPPILTLAEASLGFGLDNLAVPLIVIWALALAS